MATEHPKVTAYIPKEILKALDDWKQEKDMTRSSAIVAILADYLQVPYPVHSIGTVPMATVLSTVLNELDQLKERVAVLEQELGTVPSTVFSTAIETASPQ